MKYEYNDGGRSQYTKIKSNHDCAVRAIAIATGLPYWGVYQAVKTFAPNLETEGVNIYDPRFITYLQSLGFVRVEGKTAMQAIPEGVVIACTTGHYAAVINGTIQDVRNESDLAVSHYWIKGKLFNVIKGGRILNGAPLMASQALTMRRLFNRNYGGGAELKAA